MNFKRLRYPSKWKKSLLAALMAGSLLFTGCGSSNDDFVVLGNNNTNVAPTANDDAFAQILANAPTTVAAANGVLANDVVNGSTISAFTATTTAGGTVAVNADGSFTYNPPFPVNVLPTNDTFTYTLSNAGGDSTGTATLTITARAHFVDNSAAAGGNGTFNSRFDTIAGAIGVAQAGDTIFVFRGTGAAYPAFTVPAGVATVGERSGLTFNGNTVVAAGTAPTVGGDVTLNAADSSLSGFALTGGAGIVATGVSGTTAIAQTTVAGAVTGLNLNNATGTVNLTDVDISDPTGNGMDVNTFNGTVSMSQCDFSNTAFNSINLTATQGTFTVDSGTFTNSASNFIRNTQAANALALTVSNNTFTDGALDAGDAIGVDLSGTANCTLVSTSNIFTGTGAAPFAGSYDSAVQVAAAGTSQATVTVTDNTATSCNGDGFAFSSSGGQVTATVTGSSVTGSASNGFSGVATAGTVTAAFNNADTTNAGTDGFCFTGSGTGAVTATLTNGSDVTNPTGNGINLNTSNTSASSVAVNGSNVTGGDVGFRCTAVNTSTAGFTVANSTTTGSTTSGVLLEQPASASTINANIANNTNITTNGGFGVLASTSATGTVCLSLNGNTANGTTNGFGLNNGLAGTFNLQDTIANVQTANTGTFLTAGVFGVAVCPAPAIP